jgi:hypothetical protein
VRRPHSCLPEAPASPLLLLGEVGVACGASFSKALAVRNKARSQDLAAGAAGEDLGRAEGVVAGADLGRAEALGPGEDLGVGEGIGREAARG